ncbi:hypothetical protein GQ44DRAFT_722533 [Phaeosphaeriaceae sp. PMI808]|nr:hypothetical protein GQ44DRAFT_722533 [Phaeosphaeriaceae sp. PMI808]
MIYNTIVQMHNAQSHGAKILIPRWAWNSYRLESHVYQSQVFKSKIKTQLGASERQVNIAMTRTLDKNGGKKVSTLAPKFASRRHCKVKLWRFQYGGPKQVVRGAMQNEITYETPCLRSTCINCWQWHPHLMLDDELDEDMSPDASNGTTSTSSEKGSQRQICPVILAFKSKKGKTEFQKLMERY